LQITNKKEAFTCLKTITNALKDDEFIKWSKQNSPGHKR
jgi:hypothetical protein